MCMFVMWIPNTLCNEDFSAVIGEVDEGMDRQLDLDRLRAAPLQPIWMY